MRDPNARLEARSLLAKLKHAAGAERVFTDDAQAIAQRMLGDTMPSNIVMLGIAFQRGLIPVGEAALLRAIELNATGMATNQARVPRSADSRSRHRKHCVGSKVRMPRPRPCPTRSMR